VARVHKKKYNKRDVISGIVYKFFVPGCRIKI